MDALKFAIQEEVLAGTKIKVVGVGGGGSNAVARMMNEGLQGVEFHILNTDVQALNASQVPNKLAIGLAGRPRSRTPSVSSKCWKAPTWCSSRPAWAAAPALEPRLWWLHSPKN